MCVIVFKPQGIKWNYLDLYDMWMANQDGAGFAYWSGQHIIVQKGFLKFSSLKKALRQTPDTGVVLHFRMATHGIVNSAQTHPFAVTDVVKDAKAWPRMKVSQSVLFHNGIIHGYGSKEISDTIDFVSSTLAAIPSTDTQIKVLKLIDGKFALMADGGIYLIGDFETHKGCKVSNMYWSYPCSAIADDNIDMDWYKQWCKAGELNEPHFKTRSPPLPAATKVKP